MTLITKTTTFGELKNGDFFTENHDEEKWTNLKELSVKIVPITEQGLAMNHYATVPTNAIALSDGHGRTFEDHEVVTKFTIK